jgi:hypothetical protein
MPRRKMIEMPTVANKTFVARAIYHHKIRTDEHVTLLVYKDPQDMYEFFFDDSGTKHERLDGTRSYMLTAWGERNRQLVDEGFQLDNLTGENDFQRFIR